jgi:hypothetical protein
MRAAGAELAQRFPLRVVLDCLGIRPGSADPARREIVGPLSGRPAGPGGLADPVAAAAELVLGLVDRLCAAGPVVLVVDDLQWADEASVAAWGQLARSAEQLPLLLAVGCWPLPRRAEVAALRRGLAGVGAAIAAGRR